MHRPAYSRLLSRRAHRALPRLLPSFAALALALVACSGDDYAPAAEPPPPPVVKADYSYQELIEIFETQGVVGETAPVVRIVSPLNASTIAPGKGTTDGSGFLINLEVVTRGDEASVPGVGLTEANVARPVSGIRHVEELNAGKPNPDFPRLFVFFDSPLLAPDGKVFPAGHNFGAAFNVAGSDDTPGAGATLWAGWHVLESVPTGVDELGLTVAVVDDAGRIGLDRVRLKVDSAAESGQALSPPVTSFPGAAARFAARLSGEAERPSAVETSASGNGSVYYDAASGTAKVRLSFQGLSSNQTIAHIHFGDPSVAGPIVFDIDTSATPPTATSGSFELDWVIDAENLKRLQNGLLYFNVHSEINGAGEIRGQIRPETGDPLAPVVTLIAPRAPSALALGTQDSSLNASNGTLMFIQVAALDGAGSGIAVNETGIREGNSLPAGLIFDPSQIPNASTGAVSGPNRNYPGLNLTFDVPLRQPNGNVVPAGVNLAPLFDIAGSERVGEDGLLQVTADWVVGGALLAPAGKKNLTITATVTDNAGRTGYVQQSFAISPVVSGQQLSPAPAPATP